LCGRLAGMHLGRDDRTERIAVSPRRSVTIDR
jgi:hypothetical protein